MLDSLQNLKNRKNITKHRHQKQTQHSQNSPLHEQINTILEQVHIAENNISEEMTEIFDIPIKVKSSVY